MPEAVYRTNVIPSPQRKLTLCSTAPAHLVPTTYAGTVEFEYGVSVYYVRMHIMLAKTLGVISRATI